MVQIPEIIPISDLRQDAANLIRKVNKSNDPLVISQRGRASAVLIGIEAYQKREREIAILKMIARGEREIASGNGFELDMVMEEADYLLKGDHE